MNFIHKLRFLLGGLAILLLMAAVCRGLAAGLDESAAVWCLVGAFGAAIAGAILSLTWKFFSKK